MRKAIIAAIEVAAARARISYTRAVARVSSPQFSVALSVPYILIAVVVGLFVHRPSYADGVTFEALDYFVEGYVDEGYTLIPLMFQISHVEADTVPASDSAAKAAAKGFSDGASAGDVVAIAPTKAPSDSASVTDGIIKAATKGSGDSASASDVVAVAPLKSSGDGASAADNTDKAVVKALSDGASAADSAAATVSIEVADGVEAAQAFSADEISTAALTLSATATEAVAKSGVTVIIDAGSVGDSGVVWHYTYSEWAYFADDYVGEYTVF